MVERVRSKTEAGAGDYFKPRSYGMVRSGCTLLDCAISGDGVGSWPLGRIVNVVGDKSVGKTLLAIEACANFDRQFPKGNIHYRESEEAFDTDYAASQGLPVKRVDFGARGIKTHWRTVEDLFEDLTGVCAAAQKSKVPGYYIVDSLDALSTRERLVRDLDKGSYGVQKAKLMSELFERFASDFSAANLGVMFISQIRDKIGVIFGTKYTRAGGKALNFYASAVVYLSHIETLNETIKGVKRATGVRIRAKVTKNKLAVPLRECEFTIRFGYGIDDLEASLNWLGDIKRLNLAGLEDYSTEKDREKEIRSHLNECARLSDTEYFKRVEAVSSIVRSAWQEVETDFKPKRQKYAAAAE